MQNFVKICRRGPQVMESKLAVCAKQATDPLALPWRLPNFFSRSFVDLLFALFYLQIAHCTFRSRGKNNAEKGRKAFSAFNLLLQQIERRPPCLLPRGLRGYVLHIFITLDFKKLISCAFCSGESFSDVYR